MGLAVWAISDRDPLWWIAATATWVRFVGIWLWLAMRGGARIARRSAAKCYRESLEQAWVPVAREE